ncbi:MAG: flagellar filament capping protein FliD [Proteobacteria bacterium]|nr:flagellar filament capping protein FliD [Pseudomonadota bacterium]
MAVDFINSLGAGAGIDTKALVSSLVEAERAGKKSIIDNKIEDNDAQISGLGTVVSKVTELRLAAIALNDATDFNNFNVSNSQSTALAVSAGSLASAGSHTITVANQAKAQSSNSIDAGTSAGFTSGSQSINSGAAFDMVFTLGSSNQTTQTVSVTSATPDGVVAAINGANLGVTAQLVALDTSGSNYSIQLTGQTGAESAFSISESVSELNFTTPAGFAAADADITVNGIQYARATNTIDDIISGVTLELTGATSGAATIGITSNTADARANIENFVTTFNNVMAQLNALTSAANDGALSGDSIINQIRRDIQSIVINTSSSPGSSIERLSDLGIEITKTGNLEINDTKLTTTLANSFSDIVTLFSADTNNDSEIGDADRGIAGDLSMLIKKVTASDGYLTTQANFLTNRTNEYQQDLADLETKLERLEERYTRQFLTMQTLVDQMNTTKDSLKSSFENLPYNNRDA